MREAATIPSGKQGKGLLELKSLQDESCGTGICTWEEGCCLLELSSWRVYSGCS